MPPRLALEPLEDRHLLAISLSTLDNFEDGTALGWSEGAGSSNPPTHVTDGGPAGAGDGFVRNVSGGFGAGSRLAMFNESGQWTGDYVSAGVTRIDAQLANFGTSPLAMRIAIATGPLLGPSRTSWYAFGHTFLTNNSSRSRQGYVAHLKDLGVANKCWLYLELF